MTSFTVRLKANPTSDSFPLTSMGPGFSRPFTKLMPAPRRSKGRIVAPTMCLLVLVAGCRPQAQPAPVDRTSLKPVTLPDVSKAGPSVQKQLRDGHAALKAKTDTPGISDADLGAAYGDMGMLLMAAEFRDGAEGAFQNAQALAPGDFRWPYYLAHNDRLRGDGVKSLASFERAHQLNPDDVPTLVWLGSAYLDQGRTGDAEPLFMKALSLQPQSVAVLFGLGRAALAKTEDPRAVQYFEQALSLDPKAVAIHYPLALAYRRMGNVAQAEAHLKRRSPGDIVQEDPLMQRLDNLLESAVAYEVRGAQALDEARWTDAVTYFRKGIELAPNEPSLRHKLGTALAMTGDTAAAVQQFEDVTRRWPDFAKAQYSFGVVLAANGRQREAIEHFRTAVRTEPAYVEAHLQLAEALRAIGRFEDALAEYDETARLDPRVAEAPLGAATVLAAMNRVPQARARLTEGMKFFPERPEFADGLARLTPAAPERGR